MKCTRCGNSGASEEKITWKEGEKTLQGRLCNSCKRIVQKLKEKNMEVK